MELQQIIETVCDNCQCTYAEIKGKSRMQNVVFARYFITDILRRDKKYWTLELIGLEFNRNHSTVINYISKLPMIIQSNYKNYRMIYHKILESIDQNLVSEQGEVLSISLVGIIRNKT